MPDQSPAISVLMPVFNASTYLREAMESILAQTFGDFEFICVDDGSNDTSPKILREYAERDARVVIVTKANGGVTSALNAGLKVARGEFVARMDADDFAVPERFELQIAYMHDHPDCVSVGCQVKHMTATGADLGVAPFYATHEQISEALWNGISSAMPHYGSFMRRWALTQIGNYREEFRTAQDLDLFLRLSDIGKMGNVPKTLMHYRVHETSVGARKAADQTRNAREIIRQAYERRGLPVPAELLKWTNHLVNINRLRWGWKALDEGRYATARGHAWSVLRARPLRVYAWKLAIHAMLGPARPMLRSLLRRGRAGAIAAAVPAPSPAAPGEGWGEGNFPSKCGERPSPCPLPEYRERESRGKCDGPSAREAVPINGADHPMPLPEKAISPPVPTVSVVMPLYNAQRYLPAALDSVLAQSFTDFEVIAVDDGSDDGTLGILREYALRDPRVHVITRPNTGVVGASNDGLAAARGEFIARMDGDDICMPDRFEKQVAYLREHPDCVLVGSQAMLIDPDGAEICHHRLTRFTHEEIDHDHLNRGWPVVQPTVMMRRAAVEQVGRYREEYPWMEDTDLFLRLAEIGKLTNLREALLKYRLHFKSLCHTKWREEAPLKKKLYDDTRRRRGIAAPTEAEIHVKQRTPTDVHRQWAWWALQAGNVSTARKHAVKTFRGAPLSKESWRILACAVRGH